MNVSESRHRKSNGGQTVKEIKHKLLWSSKTEKEHEAVLRECERVAELGGAFEIENVYTDNWYSFITIYYPNNELS